jgi:hypothetical protein
MLGQESAIEAAKAEGRPIPSFPPLVSAPITGSAPPPCIGKMKPSDLAPNTQAKLKKRLEGLNEKEREVEEQAIKAEIQAGEEVASSLGSIYEKQAEERRRRKEQGQEKVGDKIASFFKWG